MSNMNPKPDSPTNASEGTEYDHAAIEPHLLPEPPPQRSSSFSSMTRTPPSTPATSRTEPTASSPQPPRRHTEKSTLHRLPSIQFLPPFTQKTPFLDHSGLGTTGDPYTEQSYLFQSLQGQNERAKRLLQRLSLAEERLLLGCPATGEARKIRKEMRLVKKKMAENEQQERLTLLRLGDLYVEIQNRERWAQVQQQRVAALMAQQQQQPYYPRVFAPMVSRPAVNLTVSTSSDTVPPPLEATSPPPPPPPTAASCFFSSFPSLSPGSSCLSPLSPSFEPGLPFEENFFWSSARRNSALGKQVDLNSVCGQDDNESDGRSRSHTPAGPAPSRTSSVPRPSSCAKAGNRRASVPAVRMAWADDVDAVEG